MVVYYGIVEDVNQYGFDHIDADYGYINIHDIESIEYPLDNDRSWWIVPGTLED